jgi:NtrC-family two-component system response regulator AlgB
MIRLSTGLAASAGSSSSMETPLKILVVDDEPNIRKLVTMSLENDHHKVTTASNVHDAIKLATQHPFDIAFVDLRLGTDTGLDLIPKLLAESPWLGIVVITAYATIDTAVEAIRRGASDYVPKPFTPDQLRLSLSRVIRLRGLEQRVAGLQGELTDNTGIDLNSKNHAMRQAVDLARQVATSDATILIRGESGTGKGVIARAIHGWSNQADKMFSTVSCPSLSPQLLESELFGHVKGSFTNAIRDNPGRIAATEGGTLFLDEIGDLPLNLQPKLLRFLQDREYERVGDSVTRRADVRVITATNVDLSTAVANGTFREDLFYRINVIQIDVPPLRDRPEDVLPLAENLLKKLSQKKPIAGFTTDAAAALQAYSWPGNVRELRNVIERATILCRGDRAGIEHFPSGFATKAIEPKLGDPVPFEQIEAIHIRRLLATSASIDEAAKALGIDATTLWRKRKKYNI